jgi:hypothetical protein
VAPGGLVPDFETGGEPVGNRLNMFVDNV